MDLLGRVVVVLDGVAQVEGAVRDVAGLVRAAVDGGLSPAAAGARLAALAGGVPIDGYWHGRPGLDPVKEVAG